MGLRLLLRRAHPDARGRAFHHAMRIAHAIAVLNGCEMMGEKQIYETIGYRVLDRQGPAR